MKVFDELVQIADTLLGPQGCPWDREQTLLTLQPYLLEEAHELIEAIDLNDPAKIEEELGDCIYALLFIAKLAEQKDFFTISDCLEKISQKLIRRHPHIFSEVKVESTEDVVRNWEEIKKKEGKTNPISGIPPALPSLARAQKVLMKMKRHQKTEPSVVSQKSEEEIGKKLWEIVQDAENSTIDAESALRRYCLVQEKNWQK